MNKKVTGLVVAVLLLSLTFVSGCCLVAQSPPIKNGIDKAVDDFYRRDANPPLEKLLITAGMHQGGVTQEFVLGEIQIEPDRPEHMMMFKNLWISLDAAKDVPSELRWKAPNGTLYLDGFEPPHTCSVH